MENEDNSLKISNFENLITTTCTGDLFCNGDEMLEQLGYQKVFEGDYTLIYEYDDDYVLDATRVEFELYGGFIEVYRVVNGIRRNWRISKELFAAIGQKIADLEKRNEWGMKDNG